VLWRPESPEVAIGAVIRRSVAAGGAQEPGRREQCVAREEERQNFFRPCRGQQWCRRSDGSVVAGASGSHCVLATAASSAAVASGRRGSVRVRPRQQQVLQEGSLSVCGIWGGGGGAVLPAEEAEVMQFHVERGVEMHKV